MNLDHNDNNDKDNDNDNDAINIISGSVNEVSETDETCDTSINQVITDLQFRFQQELIAGAPQSRLETLLTEETRHKELPKELNGINNLSSLNESDQRSHFDNSNNSVTTNLVYEYNESSSDETKSNGSNVSSKQYNEAELFNESNESNELNELKESDSSNESNESDEFNQSNRSTNSNESTDNRDSNKSANEIVISCEEENDYLLALRLSNKINPINNMCAICLGEEEITNEVCTCGAYYHEECWEKWVSENKTCPTCRKRYNSYPIYGHGPVTNVNISINNIGPRRASRSTSASSTTITIQTDIVTFIKLHLKLFLYFVVVVLIILYFFVFLPGKLSTPPP